MTLDTITIPTMSKTVFIQMRINEDLKTRLQEAATRRGVDLTSLIIHAVTAQYPEVMGPRNRPTNN